MLGLITRKHGNFQLAQLTDRGVSERRKNMGYNSAKEFNQNVLKWIEKGDSLAAYTGNDDSY